MDITYGGDCPECTWSPPMFGHVATIKDGMLEFQCDLCQTEVAFYVDAEDYFA